MTQHLFFLNGGFLLIFTLGCFSQKQKVEWTFNFPQSINTLRHADVEIPCNFTAPTDYGEARIVWYVYSPLRYPVVYSEDPSTVIPEYRGRTSLVGNGIDSCSLRIRDVRRTEWYYPGISEEINSYDLYEEETKKAVHVKVQGCSENLSCKDWEFTFPRSIEVLKGSCVEIPCNLKHPDNAQNFTLLWYKKKSIGYPKIFNSRTPTDVEKKYKGRTFLVGNSVDTCSLRINDVQEPDEIYPGISQEINSYQLHNERFCRVSVIDTLPVPMIKGPKKMKENEPVNITCSVDHTCASSPPSIAWNRFDSEVTKSHEYRDRGIWLINSTMKYVPSHRDDKTQLECIVTFPNKKISRQSVTLDVKYEPKNVTISVINNTPANKGDNITLKCTSRANPPVTEYKWYGETRTLTGVQITVQNVTSGKYICSASNDRGTTNSSVFSFTEQYAANYEKSKNNFIIGGIAGFTALLILVLVVTFCILKRKKLCHTPAIREVGESPGHTYTTLKKREVADDYETLTFDNRGSAAAGNENEAPDYDNIQI